MTWRDLRSDIEELFDQSAILYDAETVARARVLHRRQPSHDPAPHTRMGRVLLAVVAGHRRPRAISSVTGLHRMDVVGALKDMRRLGMVCHEEDGWVLT